jgi:hypothetical protein
MTDSRSRLGIRSAHPTDCARALQARVGFKQQARRTVSPLPDLESVRFFNSQSAVLTSRGATASAGLSLGHKPIKGIPTGIAM